MRKKQIVSLFVLFALAGTLLCCARADTPREEATTAEKSRQVPQSLVGLDLGGREFTLCVASEGWGWGGEDLWRAEDRSLAGDPIYDAVMQRNLDLAEQYGIVMQKPWGIGLYDGAFSRILQSLQSGDGAFDAVSTKAESCVRLALGGYLTDLAALASVHPENPWWDEKMVRDCTFGSHLYFLVGEYSLCDKEATYAFAFHKGLYDQYKDDPAFGADGRSLYEIVQRGEWTFEKMLQMADYIGNDLDGNGKYDENDRYGLCYEQTNYVGFLGAAGIRLAGVNRGAEQPFSLQFASEKTFSLWQRLTEMARSSATFNSHFELNEKRYSMFFSGRILFFSEYIRTMLGLRNAAADVAFGIVPFPKYDKAQAEYISPVHEYGTNFLCIPAANSAAEETGAILEALNYESMHTLTPAFTEKLLVGNLTRDEESEPMLSLIFSSRSYDFGLICNLGGFHEPTLLRMFNAADPYIASRYAAYEPRMRADLEKLTALFAE